MLPVRSVWAHFARPASALNGFGPLRALEDLRIVDLVDRRVNWARRRQLAHTPSDGEARGLALHAGDATDPGHLQQIRHVLGVVDFVEQRLYLRGYVHRRDRAPPASRMHPPYRLRAAIVTPSTLKSVWPHAPRSVQG